MVPLGLRAARPKESNVSAGLLYVDDVLEAASAKNEFAGSMGTVIIECRKTMSPRTSFTSRVDDVRIYNRAVKP